MVSPGGKATLAGKNQYNPPSKCLVTGTSSPGPGPSTSLTSGHIHRTAAAIERVNLLWCYACHTMDDGEACVDVAVRNDTALMKKCHGEEFLLTALLDNTDMSTYEPEQADQILELACRFYLKESDDFCIEYLTYILNVCLRDPQMAHGIVEATEFLEKFKLVFVNSENPDTVFNSIEALHRMLLVQSAEQMLEFTTQPDFPVDRIICEVTNEFQEIRKAALKTLKTLLADTGEDSVFEPLHRCFFVLEQLVKAFCENPQGPEAADIVEVLATALRSEKMTKLFFEQNLFDLVVEQVRSHMDLMPLEMRCTIIAIFAETAQYEQFLKRMHRAEITDMFLNCLMQNKPAPAAFVIQGLHRMSQHPDALRRIVAAYEEGAIRKLVAILLSPDVAIKVREQAAEFLSRLLVAAFRDTAAQLQEQDIAAVLTAVITQGQPTLSIDLILSLLTIIESLAQNEEYRTILGEYRSLTEQLAQLLMVVIQIYYLVS